MLTAYCQLPGDISNCAMKEPESKPHRAWPHANTPVSPSEINTLACFFFPLAWIFHLICFTCLLLLITGIVFAFVRGKTKILRFCFRVCFEKSRLVILIRVHTRLRCHRWNLQQAACLRQIEIEHRDSSKHALIMFMQLIPRHGRDGGFRSGCCRRVWENLPKRSGPQTRGREGGSWGHPLRVHL